MNGHRKEEMNTSPLEADWHQEMFDFTPSPFSKKKKLEFYSRQDGSLGHESIIFSVSWLSE